VNTRTPGVKRGRIEREKLTGEGRETVSGLEENVQKRKNDNKFVVEATATA
jgi:hypothetical protein